MSIESFEALKNTLDTLPPSIPLEKPSDSLILELFRLLSKELEQKNALIKDLIRTLSTNKPKDASEEPNSGLGDIIQLAQPFISALAAQKKASDDE